MTEHRPAGQLSPLGNVFQIGINKMVAKIVLTAKRSGLDVTVFCDNHGDVFVAARLSEVAQEHAAWRPGWWIGSYAHETVEPWDVRSDVVERMSELAKREVAHG